MPRPSNESAITTYDTLSTSTYGGEMPAGGNDLREASQVDQYVAAVHFAMTTMATVGGLQH